MFDTYIWWISRFPILSIYKFYSCLSKMFFFRERENGCFFVSIIVWTTTDHTTLMYIVLQHSLHLIFNITTLLCLYIPCLNQKCFILTTNNTSMNTHSQKWHNKNKRMLQGEKTGVLFFMNSVHVIMYNTARSYLNGLRLIIIIIFFQ